MKEYVLNYNINNNNNVIEPINYNVSQVVEAVTAETCYGSYWESVLMDQLRMDSSYGSNMMELNLNLNPFEEELLGNHECTAASTSSIWDLSYVDDDQLDS